MWYRSLFHWYNQWGSNLSLSVRLHDNFFSSLPLFLNCSHAFIQSQKRRHFFSTFTLRPSWKVCHGLKIEKDGEDMWEGECGMKLPGRLYKTEVFHKYINLFVILAEWVAVRRAVHIHTYTFGRTHNGFSIHQHSCCEFEIAWMAAMEF